MKLDARCQSIELIICDVDGVLTDGGLIFNNEGIETKRFHVHDGMGIKIWQRAGYRLALLTSRNSHIVKVRAAELGIDIVRQGFETKLPIVKEMAAEMGLSLEQICFLGDDLPDLATIRAVGLGVAVADAASDVREAAHHVTKLAGGRGAARETIELILKTKHRWQDVLRRFE
jgi:YrbI family 3-deoxy-D-manno-octulosonate 8-phosphate phosphatase